MKILSEIIKKILYHSSKFLWRTVEVGFIFLIVLIFLFRSHSFQTFSAAKITNYYSSKLATNFLIDRVKLNGMEYLELHDFYIEDLAGDTLIYSPLIKANLKDFSLEDKFAVLDYVITQDARVKIQQYQGAQDPNFQFIVDYFNKNEAKDAQVFTLKIDDIGLENAHLSYHNWNVPIKDYGLDYQHLDFKNFSGDILELRNRNGITTVDLKEITFNERCGLTLNNLSGHFLLNPKKIKLEKFSLSTPFTNLSSKGMFFNYHDLDDLQDFVNAVTIQGAIEQSKLSFKDLSYFLPMLKSVDRTIDVSGNISGSINDLFIDELSLGVSTISYFKGDLELKGITDLEHCLISLNIDNCQTSKLDLERLNFKSFGFSNDLKLPVEFERLGVVKLSGSLAGFFNDFSTEFNIASQQGQIIGDFACFLDSRDDFNYKGSIKTTKFNAGEVFDNSNLGMFSSDLLVAGKGLSLANMDVSLNGSFTEFDLLDYGYDNISIKGDLKNNSFDGELVVMDDNVDLFFEGAFDLSQYPVQFDFNLNVQKAHLFDLNIIDQRESSSLCFNLFASGFGSNLDDFSGMIEVKNIGYYENGQDYYFDSILFDSQSNAYRHNIELYSKFAEFKMGGEFNLDSLSTNLYNLGSKIVPSILPQKQFAKSSHDDFLMDFKINDLTKLTELFFPDISVSKNTKLNCSFNSDNELLALYTSSDWIEYNGIRFSNIKLDTTKKLEEIDTSYLFSVSVDTVFFNQGVYVQNVKLTSKAFDDNIDLHLNWQDDDSLYNGSVQAAVEVYGKNHYKFDFIPTTIYSKKAGTWTFGDSIFLTIDSSSFKFENFLLANNNQSIDFNGTIAENKTDQFNFNFKNIDLNDLNSFINAQDISISGQLNSSGTCVDFYSAVFFDAKTTIKEFQINNYSLGNLVTSSRWNTLRKRMELGGSLFNDDFSNGIKIKKSYYYPYGNENVLDFGFVFKDFDLGFVNPFLPKEVLSDLSGKLDGKVRLTGNLNAPKFKGELNLSSSSLKVDMLNTSYSAEGKIIIKPDMIAVNGIPITDKYGAKGTLVGSYFHKNFSSYSYDFYTSFYQPFMVLNTTYKMNPLYYGDAFITGDVMMEYDSINQLRIDVQAKSEKGTDITLPLYGSDEVVLQDFISFNGPDNLQKQEEYEVDLEGINMNLSLDLTNDAQLQLVFDEIVGDAIKGRGEGHVDMVIDQFNDFSMYGQYTVSEGSYLFTLKDFINKKFNVKPGGSISWYGDPYNADLDLVTYYPLKASLYDIMPDTEKEDWKQKKDIHVEMHLTDNLFNPDIDFDIAIPRANESAKSALRNLVSSEQEMNKQVFSLLILNKFMTNRQDISTATVDVSLSTTSEMLTSQLSNMISKFSDDFDIGFNYRPGDEISNDEVSIAMSTQQFNNRLTIETNLGVSQGNKLNQNPSSFIGDVDVEYKINSDGNLRVHAFNESNEYDFTNLDQTPYTQGVGAFYKQSFNNLGELFCEMGNLFKLKKNECSSCENKSGRKSCRDK